MKPFIPLAEAEGPATQVEAGIRQFLAKEPGAKLDDRRVRSLSYEQRKNRYDAVVGQAHPLTREPILAILYDRGRDLYHVCTPNSGARGGTIMVVGGWTVSDVVWFD